MNSRIKITGVSQMVAQHLKQQVRRLMSGLKGLAFLALVVPVVAWAAPNIESVTGGVQSGGEVVKIDLSEPLKSVPTGFVVQTPARIALDFPGVGANLGRSLVEVNQGNLRSVNVVQSGDRTLWF